MMWPKIDLINISSCSNATPAGRTQDVAAAVIPGPARPGALAGRAAATVRMSVNLPAPGRKL